MSCFPIERYDYRDSRGRFARFNYRYSRRDSRGRFVKLPAFPIDPTFNVRLRPDNANVADMIRELLALNYSPIVVAKREDGTYPVVSGFRRVQSAAFIANGLDDIEAFAAKRNA